jgi:hypothetical protein
VLNLAFLKILMIASETRSKVLGAGSVFRLVVIRTLDVTSSRA